jgi:hypothetical protein
MVRQEARPHEKRPKNTQGEVGKQLKEAKGPSLKTSKVTAKKKAQLTLLWVRRRKHLIVGMLFDLHGVILVSCRDV